MNGTTAMNRLNPKRMSANLLLHCLIGNKTLNIDAEDLLSLLVRSGAIKLKDDSVNPKSITTQLLLGLLVVQASYAKRDIEFVITSLNDAVHMKGSKHYEGNAADIRTRTASPHELGAIAEESRARLHPDYDLVVESNHIHLEYDPK